MRGHNIHTQAHARECNNNAILKAELKQTRSEMLAALDRIHHLVTLNEPHQFFVANVMKERNFWQQMAKKAVSELESVGAKAILKGKGGGAGAKGGGAAGKGKGKAEGSAAPPPPREVRALVTRGARTCVVVCPGGGWRRAPHAADDSRRAVGSSAPQYISSLEFDG